MRSEGSRLLGLVQATRRQVATRIGVSPATVSYWISGQRVPEPDHRRAMLAAYRIPVSAWPNEWQIVRDLLVEKLAERAPDVLLDVVEELERLEVITRK